MKKVNQLLIIEADDSLPPLLSQFQIVLSSFSELPVLSKSIDCLQEISGEQTIQLVLFHSNVTSVDHLRQFVEVYSVLPNASFVVVSDRSDEGLALLILEAGAEDVIATRQLSTGYLHKAVVLSIRRSNTKKGLVQSREQLLATIQNTPNVAVQWYNSKSEVLFWNKASERIFGHSALQAVGKTIDELIVTPSNKNFWRNKIRHLAETKSSYGPQEWWFACADGSECCCISTLFPIPSSDNDQWFVCMDVDITAQKQMEKALRTGEEKYRSLLEQQADAILIFDEEGKILDVNTSTENLLQYSRDEFKQMNLDKILDQDEVKKDPIRFDLMSKGESSIKQRRMHRKNKEVVNTEVNTKRLVDGIFVATIRDLEKRIEIQNTLQKEIELSDTIINSLPGLFYLFTKDNQYLRWNKQLELISGYSAEEIKKITPLEFFDVDEQPAIAKTIEDVFANGHSYVEGNLFTKSGKKIPYFFTGISVQYANTECLLGTGIDLSPLRNLEAKLSQQKITEQKKVMQAMIDAEEKERNKLGLELHDNVNQILSVVRMYLAILDSDQPMKEVTISKTMELLNKAIGEIRQLSHNLAVTYKFEAGLADALKEMIDQIKLTRDFVIELEVHQQIDRLANDSQKLAIYRVIQEQLSNIIKHAKASVIEIKASIENGSIGLSIKDNGLGFDTGNIEKGLGLNNITNRVESLEGKVDITSEPSKGSQIMVTIPLRTP